jgi:hypothetical protein
LLAQTARKNNSREECCAYGASFLRGIKMGIFISIMMVETVSWTKSIDMEFCIFCMASRKASGMPWGLAPFYRLQWGPDTQSPPGRVQKSVVE